MRDCVVGPGGVPLPSSTKDLQLQTSVKALIGSKALSAALANRPKWRSPPDPEKVSPGAVEAATGAVIKTVPGGTTSRYSKSEASVQSAAFAVDDEQDRIDGVAEHDGKYRAADIGASTSSVATAGSSATSSPRSTPPSSAPTSPSALTPLQAIRQNCLSCCCGSAHEVALCPAKACPAWPFRFGRKPTDEIIAAQGDTPLHPLEWRVTAAQFHAGRQSALKAIKAKCFDCSGAEKSEVRKCAFKDCALHPFRQGRNPNRVYSPEERARRSEHLAKAKNA